MLDWRLMAARAATLDERLSGQYQALAPAEEKAGGPDRSLADTRLRLWCDSVAQGDWQVFQRRLHRDGLDLKEVHRLLGDLQLKPDEELPVWVGTGQWLLEALVDGIDPQGVELPSDWLEEEAFADLLWPVVQQARIQRDCGDAKGSPATYLKHVTAKALLDLDRVLLSQLSQLAGLTLFESFNFYRLTDPEPLSGAPEGRGIYLAFVEALRAGPLVNLVDQKPVLLRLLAVSVDQWIENTRLFLMRLEADSLALERRHSRSSPPEQVVSVKGGLSDPHFGGQCVFQIAFQSGERWLYKPRDLALDAAWHGLLGWLSQQTEDGEGAFALPAVQPLCREGYGWLPFVPHDLDLSVNQVPAYFTALGQVLAVMELLSGSDMHMENIRVADGLPVVIDLETLLQPDLKGRPASAPELEAERAVTRELLDTVLRVGLLPEWLPVGGAMMGMSGLSPKSEQGYTAWRLQSLNRDDLSEDRVRVEEDSPSLLPLVDGQEIKLSDQVEHLISGYDRSVDLLVANKSDLLSDGGPLSDFADQKVRVVVRPTLRYGALRQAATWPANQSDGVQWSLRFEDLGRAFVYDRPEDPMWPLFKAERLALSRMDIPVLQTSSSASGLQVDGHELELEDSLFEDPAFDTLVARLARMESRRAENQAIIRQTAFDPQDSNFDHRNWPQKVADFQPAEAEKLAFSLAEHLATQAQHQKQSLAWLAANALDDGSALKLGPLPDNLYEGQMGPALFLAACYAVNKDEKWRDLALDSLAATQLRISSPEGARQLCQQIGIGGFAGLGSLVYGFCQLARLLEKPDLLVDARRAAMALDARTIASDRMLDIVGGAAGACLALLALEQATGETEWLGRAQLCGLRLLEAWQEQEPEGWRGAGDAPLTGFSHGAAGIGHALLLLYNRTGQSLFRQAAERGFAWEEQQFNPERKNWPDLRQPEKPVYLCQWCHGAGGIALSRVTARQLSQTKSLDEGLSAAIDRLLEYPDAGPDHLCCGTTGRIAMISYLSRAMQNDQLRAEAQARMSAFLARVDRLDQLLIGLPEPKWRLGFMQGFSGIGYFLLQEAHPGLLPDVLLLQ
ncbi:type 2 lanthipeptide synthetase LanM [Rhodovibrionaceae bacterium A322]